MCFIIDQNNANRQIATEDIPCYKVLQYTEEKNQIN